MSRIIFFILVIIFNSNNVFAKELVISINQFAQHPALDEVKKGIEQGLKEEKVNAKFLIENAQGNITTSVQISNHLASLNPDIMIAIATPAAQTTLKARKNKQQLIAFAAVTDPKLAGLDTQPNIIGIADNPPVEELLKEAVKTFPKMKNIGIIFNPAEINSQNTIKRIKASAKNFNFIEVPISSSNDAMTAVKSLIGKVDVIYIPQDNTVVSAIDAVIKVSTQNKLPLISNDPLLVKKGVTMALGCNYFDSGKQLAKLIADVINHKSEKVIQPSHSKELLINQKALKELSR